MVFVRRSTKNFIEPIYSSHRCINSREVVECILQNCPNETLITLAKRARVIKVHTIEQWKDRNSANGKAMKRMFESIIEDYGSN